MTIWSAGITSISFDGSNLCCNLLIIISNGSFSASWLIISLSNDDILSCQFFFLVTIVVAIKTKLIKETEAAKHEYKPTLIFFW